MNMSEVGFVGPGQMGRPMVERLLAAGHTVSVYARRPELRAELADAGAHVVDSCREAATAPVVLACFFSDEQLQQASDGPDGLLAGLGPGAVLASHVTGSRATLHALSDAAAKVGAEVVSAPVSGIDDDIRAGRLTVLLGGDDDAVRRVGEVVRAYAGTLVPTGDLGSALAVKLVNNLLFAAHAQTAAEAVALGRELGVAPELLLRAVASCSGASYAAATLAKVPSIEYFAEVGGPFLRKDVAACVAELGASGAEAGLLLDVVRRGPLDLS
ncbi:MAG: garR 3 [Pseudonocardiales bacterium]|nr:garR 3 [Pseudonocardiales bacterium]